MEANDRWRKCWILQTYLRWSNEPRPHEMEDGQRGSHKKPQQLGSVQGVLEITRRKACGRTRSCREPSRFEPACWERWEVARTWSPTIKWLSRIGYIHIAYQWTSTHREKSTIHWKKCYNESRVAKHYNGIEIRSSTRNYFWYDKSHPVRKWCNPAEICYEWCNWNQLTNWTFSSWRALYI